MSGYYRHEDHCASRDYRWDDNCYKPRHHRRHWDRNDCYDNRY